MPSKDVCVSTATCRFPAGEEWFAEVTGTWGHTLLFDGGPPGCIDGAFDVVLWGDVWVLVRYEG